MQCDGDKQSHLRLQKKEKISTSERNSGWGTSGVTKWADD